MNSDSFATGRRYQIRSSDLPLETQKSDPYGTDCLIIENELSNGIEKLRVKDVKRAREHLISVSSILFWFKVDTPGPQRNIRPSAFKSAS